MPPTLTWWVACNFLHVYSLWISWRGVQLLQALAFHMLKPVLHMSTTNQNHMRYGSWDMECQTECFLILDHFCPFTPLTTQKIKILKEKKLEDIIIYTSAAKIITCYTVPEIWHVTDVIVVFHFGLIVAFLPP